MSNWVVMLASTIGQVSWLAELVLEAATLKGLLRNPTTSAKAEYFLRYTVVRDLVAQLQSPNPASVLRDVHPFLVESSTHFIHMVEKQCPVSRERYSCPTFLWWWSHCHIYSLHVWTQNDIHYRCIYTSCMRDLCPPVLHMSRMCTGFIDVQLYSLWIMFRRGWNIIRLIITPFTGGPSKDVHKKVAKCCQTNNIE